MMPTPTKPAASNKHQSLAWIAAHHLYYLRLNTHILSRGVPLRELLVLKYPLLLPDAVKPPTLSIDFTDACDLQCVYCNNPLFPTPRTMMSDAVFGSLLDKVRSTRINRIRIGGGEPMLHPNCAAMLQELAPCTKYLGIISNGQWKEPDRLADILRSGVNLFEVSIDAGGAGVYESSRPRASYTRLLQNLRHLHQLRNRLKSKTLIKIRLMLRPSTKALEWQETRFWRHYADCVLPQMILKHPESDYCTDVYFAPATSGDRVPQCSLPFKDLEIRPDGRIPLCPAKGCSLQPEKQHFLGDIREHSLPELWNGAELRALRRAHRSREGSILEGCKGCNYS